MTLLSLFILYEYLGQHPVLVHFASSRISVYGYLGNA
jgi:hypothetical protein